MEETHDAGASGNISKTRSKQKQDTEELVSALYHQIGQLKVEVDWLKKLSSIIADKRGLIEPENSQISIARQCSYYAYPVRPTTIKAVGSLPITNIWCVL